MQAAYGEAEEALKLHQMKFCQQREQMQNAIMAGLELEKNIRLEFENETSILH